MKANELMLAMRTALRDAHKRDVRITHWQINYAAQDTLFSDRTFNDTFCDYRKPMDEQECYGIPFKLQRDQGETPTLEPLFEHRRPRLNVDDVSDILGTEPIQVARAT